MPKWALILLIAVPAAAIVGLVAWKQLSSGPEPVVVDPNQQIAELEGQVAGFEKEYQAISGLIFEEKSAEASARGRKLADRINRWLDEWEALMQPLRNEEGDLPPDLEGYEAVPAPVLGLRNDLLKISGF